MKKDIAFLTATSLDGSKTTMNRLLPMINEGLLYGYNIHLFSPDRKKIEFQDKRFKHYPLLKKTKKNANFFIRLFNEIYISYLICSKAKRKKSLKVVMTIPSPLLIYWIFIFKKNSVYVDVRDLTWEYLPSKTILQRALKYLAKKSSLYFLKRSKTLIASNRYEQEYLNSELGISNVKLIENGISRKQYKEMIGIDNSNHCPTVGYFGNIGPAQDIGVLLELAKRNKGVKFLISGNGLEFNKIQSIKKQNNLENVEITNRLDWEELKQKYKETNIFFAQLNKDYRSAVPSKLFEYLSSGKFIFFSGSGQAKVFLDNFDNCITDSSYSIDELDKKLKEIVSKGIYRATSEKNQIEILKNYIREDRVKVLYDSLSSE